ncbi:AAA-like domain-containing protein [Sorangium sp. So ce429]
MTLLSAVRDRVASSKTVILVGAGVSINATRGAGCASWTGLLTSGVKHCEELGLIDDAERDRLIEDVGASDTRRLLTAAEIISNHLGAPDGGEYRAWLRDTVGSLRPEQREVLEAVKDLGCRIATTNYDGLIEEVTGFRPATWRDRDAAQRWFSGDDPRRVLHLHGHWEDPASVVLGIRSYEDILRDSFAQALLRALPYGYSLLFVGFGAGLGDPNFSAFLRWVGDVFKESTNRHYRLALQGELRGLKQDGQPRLFAVPYGSAHGDLAPFLRGLRPIRSAATLAQDAGRSQAAAAASRFFISYRRGGLDEQLAKRLHEALEASGHAVFRDANLSLGADWASTLRSEIERADFFVPLLSAEAIRSEMVSAEVRIAYRKGSRGGRPKILPVRVAYDGPLDYELDLHVGRLQYVRWASAADDDAVIAAVRDAPKGIDPVPAAPPRTAEERPCSVADAPSPRADPRRWTAPTGALPKDDPLYVERAAEQTVRDLAEGDGHTLTVFGPGQHGKSSLLIRYLAACRAQGKLTGLVDFQGIPDGDFDDYRRFLTVLADEILVALDVHRSPPVIEDQANMRRFLQVDVLGAIQQPIVLGLDKVDRVVGRPYQLDFFAMLRSWYNRAQSGLPWSKLGLALVISTEPHLLIEDARQSPFNVGYPIGLSGLTIEECRTLDSRYPTPLPEAQIQELYQLLRGHPYLTRRACHMIHIERLPFEHLERDAADPEGPFRDHLRTLLTRLAKDPRLLPAVRRAIQTGTIDDERAAARLCAAGILVRQGERYNPANLLYFRFFRQAR